MSDTTVVLDQPGVYDDIPHDVYLADPVPGGSLTASGAKKLLPPSCPALFRHERDHGGKHKRQFDVGHAAHQLVLGVGPELYVLGGDNFLTKKVKQERDEVYADGGIPLLPADYNTVQAMAVALRAHPRAADLFADDGAAEQTMVWRDDKTGVWCRARPDWLTDRRIIDYKTTTSVEPGAISRAVASYSYHVQDAFYLAGAAELGVVDPDDVEFLFVFQAKEAPYLVTVVDLDEQALRIGAERMRAALEIYADCVDSGVWPGYSDDIETISLPGWYVRTHERDMWW